MAAPVNFVSIATSGDTNRSEFGVGISKLLIAQGQFEARWESLPPVRVQEAVGSSTLANCTPLIDLDLARKVGAIPLREIARGNVVLAGDPHFKDDAGPVGALDWTVAATAARAHGLEVLPLSSVQSLQQMVERGRLRRVAIADAELGRLSTATGVPLVVLAELRRFSAWLSCSPGTPIALRDAISRTLDQLLASGELKALAASFGLDLAIVPPPK